MEAINNVLFFEQTMVSAEVEDLQEHQLYFGRIGHYLFAVDTQEHKEVDNFGGLAESQQTANELLESQQQMIALGAAKLEKSILHNRE
jgi:hypothetical protein